MAIDTITSGSAQFVPEAAVTVAPVAAKARFVRFDLRWFHPYALAMIIPTFLAKSRSRRALSKLSDDALVDIGITRDQALREAERIRWSGDWYS